MTPAIRTGKKVLSNKTRQWWTGFHFTFMGVWLTGTLASVLLVLMATKISSPALQAAAQYYVSFLDWFLIIPGGMGTLITGFVLAWRTNWGVTKYWWILFKLVANIGIILYGGIFIRQWAHEAVSLKTINAGSYAFLTDPVYLHKRELLLTSMTACAALMIIIFFISVFKPWGKRGK